MQTSTLEGTQLPFPLFTQETFQAQKANGDVFGQQNELILSLRHKCNHKWEGQEMEDWGLAKRDEIRLLVISWNMHGMIPGYSLKRLFKTDSIYHDIVVIGTQECQRSILASLVCSSKETWERKLQEELGVKYARISSATLNAMHLIAFARRNLVQDIKIERSSSLSQGFVNLVGNKGGVALSFLVRGKSFLFVNSHLESGQNAQPVRSRQFQAQLTYFEQEMRSSRLQNQHYDYVIWTGDFNSRINVDLSESTLRRNASYFDWLERDQIYQERLKNNTSLGQFKEGMIFFPPTYRLLDSENKFTSEGDFRIPGWCDRILFRVGLSSGQQTSEKGDESRVTPLSEERKLELWNYDSNYEILGSDHRPVYAQFTAKV